jgi:hypothetical protein
MMCMPAALAELLTKPPATRILALIARAMTLTFSVMVSHF